MAENQQNGKKSGVEEDKKLFVGGLTLETTEKDIKDYFEPHGQIVSVTLKLNPQTGKSKGFAFVVFANPETVEQILAKGEHQINGKTIDVKKAKAKPGKIFVGGITQEITDDDIKQYFGQYGNITQVEMPFDKTKNQRKPFCFVTFDNDSVVRELLKRPKQTIKDKQVDVKKAATQPAQMGRGGFGGWSEGGRGGRGGGRGGGWGGQGGWDQGWGDYGYGGGYDNGYGGTGGYDYSYGGGYGGGYGMDTSSYGKGGGYAAAGGRGGGRGARGGRGGQRHQPY